MVMVASVVTMVRVATGWGLLLLAVVTATEPPTLAAMRGRHVQKCRTFTDEKLDPGESKSYRCPAEECPDGEVYGTDMYHGDSDICLAALHSGVITSLAASITITRLSVRYNQVLGTAKNRIVSQRNDRSHSFPVYKVENTMQEEGVVGELMLVYSFPEEGVIRFICLSQDQKTHISSKSLKSWKYEDIHLDVKSGEGSPKLVLQARTRENRHALRLLGSRRDEDVLAVVQYPNAEYQALSATVRASMKDNVTINFLGNTERRSGQVYVRRLPEGWSVERLQNLSLRLLPARPSDTGIYIVHDGNVEYDRALLGAYYDVLVRGCRRGFFGVSCARECPECLNGGQCHSQRGTCVCAPGFIGDRCQYACPPGFFGNECQFKCHGRTVAPRDSQRKEVEGNRVEEEDKEGDEEGGCRGFTMCLPPPYGCSCAAGFKHPSKPGATCTQRCSSDRYGADCEQRCDGCVDGACHPYSGTCTRGCRHSYACRKGPPRPVLALVPHLRGYEASWDAATDSHARYFVTQQLLHRLSCTTARTQKPRLHFQPFTKLTYTATALLPYTAYNVCVVASSPAGLSSPGCSTVNTLPEAPSMNITQLSCEETGNRLQCRAIVSDGCESHNGPNLTIKFTLHTQLSCPSNLTTLRMSVKLSGSSGKATFAKYLAGKTYAGEAVVENLSGTGRTRSLSYTTNAKAPPPVRNVTHAVLSDSVIQLLWNDPCPPNGEIQSLYVQPSREGYIPVQQCATTDLYDRCHNIAGLELGKQYEYCIQVQNKHSNWGPRTCHKVKLEEKEPGPPQSIRALRGARHLNLSLVLPVDPGGKLRNCTITLSHFGEPCVVRIFEGAAPMNCEFRGLEEGRIEEAQARCCNARFCGRDLRQRVATQPLPPQIDGNFHIVKKTNTTITLRFPAVTSKRDGIISVIVFVQLETPNKSLDLSAEVVRLFEAQRHKTRRKRSTSESEGHCREQLWVAAELDQDLTEFVVGDGNTYRGFDNCPLKRGKKYNVGIMGVNELLGATTYSSAIVKEEVVVEPYDASPSSLLFLLLLLLLLLVLVVLGALAYYRRHKQPGENEWMARFCNNVNQENADNNELQDTNMGRSIPVLVTEDIVENDAIYENVKPASCAAGTTQVSYAEVEAYLNKVIGTAEAGEDFRTVPRILAKSRTAGERPENAAKNRFRNILPYDDTRVVLSCLCDDPCSDYINASHVEGYGDMRYIASQGPKDANVCTIADFWRMVVEQRIDVIIMLANFVEMGKKKVGEYFNPGQTLNFDDFEITLKRREQLPYFTVSSLTVRWEEEQRQVQHYHYTKWPDHGVPTETVSIAQMLTHFQSHHRHGGTVVHCSAGIGRTGTVLQVLLMCEMLSLRGHLSPLDVLARLRMSRALLVENEAQYNLSLEILDEILFGKKTTVSADHLMKHLDECVLSSRVQYPRAKALPSPLTFNTSNLPIFLPLNRNQEILPADSNRYYLQPKARAEVGLSQYINAIRVPGQDKNKFMLATEHPMPHTVANFWRLVVETGSTLVFLINSVQNQDENDYPTMLWGPGEEWETEDYKLKQEKTEPYGTWLTHSKLTISSSEDWTHHVDVYQSNNWPLSSPLPPSPHILLTLAELLQVPRSPTAGPPLLCCSDGVTGCGLVAGMTLVVEGLQTEQEVNVYRTVVRLLRARQQFIVSEEQFSTLYTGAAIYLQEYSDYGNFQ